MKHIFRTLIILVLPLLVVACKTDYNFDNISLEMTVGNTDGIAIPLGGTGEITLGSLMEESGLGTNTDGYYGFEYGGNFDYSVSLGTIDPITGLVPTIAPVESELLGSISATIPTFRANASLAFPDYLPSGLTITESVLNLLPSKFLNLERETSVFEHEFEVEIPKEVASIKEIKFGNNGEGSSIHITFDLGGLANVCNSCVVKSFNIELPAGFTIDKNQNSAIANYTEISEGTGSSTPNRFQISEYPLSGSQLDIEIIVKSVDMSSTTVGTNGKVTIKQDVIYDFVVTGSLNAGTITSTAPSISALAENLSLYEASIVANEVAMEVSFSENISESVSVPAELARIDYLEIAKAGSNGTQAPKFSVSVALSGAPMDAVTLSDVEILLPEFLDIEAPSGWNYSEGKLTTPSLSLHNNQTNSLIDLTIKGIKSLPIADGTLSLNSTIGLSAKAGVGAGSVVTINTAAQNLLLTPTVTLDDIEIVQVTGLIDPDLSDLLEPQVIELGDFTSSLEGIDLDLNIQSPVMRLTVTNPIGVGIDASLVLNAYKDGVVTTTLTLPSLSILPAGEEPTTTYIVINGVAPDSPEYQCKELDGFTEMIASLPDMIEVELSAETNKDRPHTLILQDKYDFKVEYSVDAAFKFDNDKDGHIGYTVEVEDVDLSMLEDIELSVESLVLKVKSESTLPIDLSLGVELLDAEGAPIECVTSSTAGKIEGSTSQEAKLSECAITLSIASPEDSSPFADIAKTKSIRCKLEGTTLAGGGLKPEQYITANLSLLLDKGITIDLGSLSPEDEQ
ncbi:MAG: hypothetical protein J6U53_00110 [Tidjanibacter sp.]|nr:hypothetical protein [Tidjanibacter sp.]